MVCVFRHVSCVMATHIVVITVMKATALESTVCFSINFRVNTSAYIVRFIVRSFQRAMHSLERIVALLP